ncbi:hypothetical protein E2562_004304 [Oryza meyeriana var. granulata]|uniref:Uncharacterized protein n=1 Tax=Oryza meyeriana var. granulata TaxID=110450 RepID=A0A6G1BTT3_9ORYZ|nr:hypothetical protein E2562_004304 [Oryza meyeriana var. granulata]
MASYAAQLKDIFFGLVERVTGYGRGEDKDGAAGVQEPSKVASEEVLRSEEVVTVQHNVIRSRGGDPPVSGGSKPGINAVGI